MDDSELYEEWEEYEGTFLHVWGGLIEADELKKKAFADATGRLMQKYNMALPIVVDVVARFRYAPDAWQNEIDWYSRSPHQLAGIIDEMSPFKLEDF